MTTRERTPCRRAFWADLALPSGERGPVALSQGFHLWMARESSARCSFVHLRPGILFSDCVEIVVSLVNSTIVTVFSPFQGAGWRKPDGPTGSVKGSNSREKPDHPPASFDGSSGIPCTGFQISPHGPLNQFGVIDPQIDGTMLQFPDHIHRKNDSFSLVAWARHPPPGFGYRVLGLC